MASNQTPPFDHWYARKKDVVLAWLHELHAHPEIGFEEVRTAAFVSARLEEFGFDVSTGVGGTGVVGTLHGTDASAEVPARRIGIRAELDALPMQENAGVTYRSQIDGRFHGCGHDGHTVIALTAAAYLAETRDFKGTLHFIFQPAEELLTGAQAMIDDGLFERFPCDEIYALHNLPGLGQGVGYVGVPGGAAMASADNIDLTIRANGTHGSAPHTGEDAILAAANYITSVQQAATRVVDARDAAVISFGKIVGGTVRNVLPEMVTIQGTMRTNAVAARDRLAKLLRDVATSVELSFGVSIEISVESVTPVAVNDSDSVAAVLASAARVVGAERTIENARSLMASEDFSEMQRRVPGAYFFLGQSGRFPHHPEYVFDPGIIPIGAAIFADLARSRSSAQLNSNPAS